MERWLDRVHLPSALFCTDFNSVTVLMSLLSQRGIRVPDDISLVGFDDPPAAILFNPPITTVHFSVKELGRRAFNRLLTEADRDIPIGTDLLPVQLVERGSTAAPHAEHPEHVSS